MSFVYVSPLKALSYDVERNLRAPLAGIGADLRVALRTGDTPQRERQAMIRKPPDILITTPESLYLMLTSQARDILTDVEALIVDEIHAVAPTKRGAHMALTLERLERHVAVNANDGAGRERPVQRIGLSATQRPLERIAAVPRRPRARVHDRRRRRSARRWTSRSSSRSRTWPTRRLDRSALRGAAPDRRRRSSSPGPIASAPRLSRRLAHPGAIWPAIYPELLSLVREHTSTIIFVNNRRGAERLAKRLNEMNAEELEAGGRGGGRGRPTEAQRAPQHGARP